MTSTRYGSIIQCSYLALDDTDDRPLIIDQPEGNLDPDQIIVANASPQAGGGPLLFTYAAGCLEDAEIRKVVCDILEGGEKAFRERARRLRVRLER